MVCALAILPFGCTAHRLLVRQDETVILTDMRKIQSAEGAYEATMSFYGSLECLAVPTDCIKGYPSGHPFLSKTLANLVPENGYSRQFFPGPAAPRTALWSPGSLRAWAYTATPIRDGRGRKAFCADSSGRICAGVDGRAPAVTDGQCITPCDRVQ
jgi:hypothetical protein